MGKFLRKIMLLFVVAVFSVSLTAQNKLSVNLGYLNSNTTLKSSMTGIQLSTELPSNGFVVGAAYDVMFANSLGVSLGLDYALTFGNKSLQIQGMSANSTTYNIHTLELPIRLLYEYPIEDDISVFAFAGPKLALDLAWKGKEKYGNLTKTFDMYDEDVIYRFNLLLGPGLGARYRNFQIKLGYDWGLLNRYNKNNKAVQLQGGLTPDVKLNTNNFYVMLGLVF
jgi:hypothetical protein